MLGGTAGVFASEQHPGGMTYTWLQVDAALAVAWMCGLPTVHGATLWFFDAQQRESCIVCADVLRSVEVDESERDQRNRVNACARAGASDGLVNLRDLSR